MRSTQRRTLFIVFAIVLVDMLGVGILIPIIPLLFSDPSYPYYLGLDHHTGYLLLGLLTALYPLTMFISLPILGQLSDTFGRKPILAISLLGTAISYVLFALGIIFRNLPLLFASRALDGITGGNVSVAQAAIADTTTHEERVRSFGLIGAANGIGFILGPLAAGILSDKSIFHYFNAPLPFWFAAGLSLVNMLAVLFIMPETLKTKTKKYIKLWQSFNNIKEAITGKAQRALYLTSFLYQSGFAFIITFFGVFLVSVYSFSQSQIGYLFAFVGSALVIAQIVLNRPLSKRFTQQSIIAGALFFMGAAVGGIYFISNVTFLYILTGIAAASAALILTNLTALISTVSKDKLQGSVLGVNSSVQALAQAIPPIFAGAIAALLAPTTPVVVAAVTIFAACVYFSIYHWKDIFHPVL